MPDLSSANHVARRVARVLPAILLALLLLYAFWGAFTGRLFYLRDISQNHYPLRILITERLLSGSLPLWDLYHNGGTPLLANPNALVLHPITLLFYVLPFDAAFGASIVLQFAVLAAGGYLLARALRLGREAALLTAAILSLSGPAASLASLQNVLSALAWVPLALWAVLRGLAPGRRFVLAPAALCVAVVLIAVEPASLLALLLVGFVLAATEAAPAPGRRWNGAACLAFGIVCLLGALVAAVEIVPAGALLSLTERGSGFAAAEGLKWSLLPERLPELVLPRLFGDPTRLSPIAWRGGFLFEGRYPFLLSIYLGAIPCLLAAIGAGHAGPDRARRRGLGAIAVLALLLALGGHSAMYRFLFGALAPLRQVRYPERFLLLFLLAVALLAGYGLERLHAGRAPSRRTAIGITAAAGAAFVLCACAATARLADGLLMRLAHIPASLLREDGGAMVRGALLRSVLWAFGEAALLAALTVYLRRRPAEPRGRIAALATVVVCALSLLAASAPVRSTAAPGWLLDGSPLRDTVGRGVGEPRLHHAPRPADLAVRAATDELVWGYRYDRFVYALMTGHPDAVPTALDPATDRMDLKEGIELGRSLEALPLSERVRVLAACRIGWLLSYETLEDPGLEPGLLLDTWSRPPARLYRVRGVVPRLRFVSRVLERPAGSRLAAALADEGYDPRSAVLLEERPDPGADGRDVDGVAPGAGAGEAEIVQETPERIAMRVRAVRKGYAVLADSFAPGWQATLDGRAVTILRADGLFRAVFVPPGDHRLEMRYRPFSVTLGLLLGTCGLVLVAAGGLAARRAGM